MRAPAPTAHRTTIGTPPWPFETNAYFAAWLTSESIASAMKFDLKVGDFPPDLLSIDTLVAAVIGAVALSLVSTVVRLVIPDR